MSLNQEVKNKLDGVGCGFCLAKWTQVTMHLHNGMTHSCHHPAPHKVPLSEIKNNPTALHNTKYKKEKRRDMLNGEKPEECNYCWKVEKSSNSFSDRVFKSSEPWSLPHLEEIKELDWRANYNPKYVEVSFSNTCNFKCSYCSPMFSSKWMEEIEKHGGYPTSTSFNDLTWVKETNQLPYKHSEENPYVESFWNWWPELYNDLHTFRVTGGEPLLSKDTWKLLEFIATTDKPNRNLNLSINTNLGVPKNLIEKFVGLVKKIIDEDRVKEFIVFTSCESYESQAEYIRNGLDFNLFIENVEYILSELPKVTINVMATFNVMSVFGYGKLIDKIFELKVKYHNNERYWVSAIQIDTSYLRWPAHLSVKILDREQKELILEHAKKAFIMQTHEFNHKHIGFSDVEVQKIKRLYDYAISKDDFDVERNQNDFITFVDEHDIRRGTNFLETFPNLKTYTTMLKIKEGEPWVMWPNNLVDNFLEFPSNRIFDYNCDFEFNLDFELTDEIITKSTLFAKLPSYLGLDLESQGILFILSEEGLDTKYISHQHNWEVGKKYSLLIKRVDMTLTIDLDSITIIQIDITTSIPNDSNSHIVFGSGNFPQNGFNLNYLSVILHYLSIKKEGVLISEHLFKKFINNKSFDETNNCNFIYKI